MDESYTLLFGRNTKLCVLLPSLESSSEIIQRKLNRSKGFGYAIAFINYPGFGPSRGVFPGSHITSNIKRLIKTAEKETDKRLSLMVGDSYGALIALGLLYNYGESYSGVRFTLTSPLISFSVLDKDSTSPQSKEGFRRYLAKHRQINAISPKQLSNLIDGKEIPDLSKATFEHKELEIYHYDRDRNLSCTVSEQFCRQKKARFAKLDGSRHSLANYPEAVLKDVFR